MLDRRDSRVNYSRWQPNQSSTFRESNTKLTISSICLVTSLPKETVRRKVSELSKKNLLKISKKDGILLGSMYKKGFSRIYASNNKRNIEINK